MLFTYYYYIISLLRYYYSSLPLPLIANLNYNKAAIINRKVFPSFIPPENYKNAGS